MTSANTTIDRLDWDGIGTQLDAEGFCLLPGILDASAARNLARQQQTAKATQSIPLHAADLGCADVLYFDASLPAPLDTWRTAFYRHLAVIANRWNETLGVDSRYPAELEDFLRRNQKAGQTRRQSHLSRLGVEGHMPLHQRNDGSKCFPCKSLRCCPSRALIFRGASS